MCAVIVVQSENVYEKTWDLS